MACSRGIRRNLSRLRTEHQKRARASGSVLLQFASGAGTVLAGLPGYIAAVNVENGGVVNVSYVPSTNSSRWPEYLSRRDRLGVEPQHVVPGQSEATDRCFGL